MLVGIGFAVMSRTSEVSRTFGYLLTIQFGLGGLGIIYLPSLVPIFGTKVAVPVADCLQHCDFVDGAIPSEYPAGEVHHERKAARPSRCLPQPALLATFLFQSANMGIYAYSIGIGKFARLDIGFRQQLAGRCRPGSLSPDRFSSF